MCNIMDFSLQRWHPRVSAKGLSLTSDTKLSCVLMLYGKTDRVGGSSPIKQWNASPPHTHSFTSTWGHQLRWDQFVPHWNWGGVGVDATDARGQPHQKIGWSWCLAHWVAPILGNLYGGCVADWPATQFGVHTHWRGKLLKGPLKGVPYIPLYVLRHEHFNQMSQFVWWMKYWTLSWEMLLIKRGDQSTKKLEMRCEFFTMLSTILT